MQLSMIRPVGLYIMCNIILRVDNQTGLASRFHVGIITIGTRTSKCRHQDSC